MKSYILPRHVLLTNCTETEDARLREAVSLLKHSFVERWIVMCLLVGVAEAGKIHTKHLLFGWAPPEFRKSTPFAARPVQAICIQASTQGGQLQEVDPEQPDDYDYFFCKLVPHGIFCYLVAFFWSSQNDYTYDSICSFILQIAYKVDK